MKWFWNAYIPEENQAARAEPTASPLRATPEQLAGLPPALILNGEADVLRDEGEAYARKLRAAGVSVTAIRFQGMIHDFVMLHALAHTNAARAALTQATATLREAFGTAERR
jgi:acetyl esterase/lipase